METGRARDLFVTKKEISGRRIKLPSVRSHWLAAFIGSRFKLVRRIAPFIA